MKASEDFKQHKISSPIGLQMDNLVYNHHGEVDRIGWNTFNSWRHPLMDGDYGYYGIPLTEDHLIKFGLDNVPYADFGFTTVSHGIEYVIERQGDWWFIGIRPEIGQTVYFVWNIYYLHTLQNIYHALTGEELNPITLKDEQRPIQTL